MKTDLEKLIRESSSIIHLEEELKSQGYRFKKRSQYLSFLSEEWEKITKKSVDEIINSPANGHNLPTLEASAEGVDYLIHGTVHGGPACFSPGWHMRKNVKSYLLKEIQSCNENFFCEENFNSALDSYGLMKELSDVTMTKGVEKKPKNMASYALLPVKAVLLMTSALAGLALIPLFSGIAYAATKRIKSPKNAKEAHSFFTQKALTDEAYQAKHLEFYIAQELPQPLNLELGYIYSKSLINKASDYLSGEPNVPTPQERSLWTANELRKEAKTNNLKRVHYLCGAAHTTEIAYFLKNPDYSFEMIENYRIAKRKKN